MFFSGTKPFSSISAETRCLSHKSLETNWSNRANGTSKAARHTTSSKPMALVSPMQGIRFKALNMFLFACRALDTMAFNAKTALLASLFVLVLAFLFKPVELLVQEPGLLRLAPALLWRAPPERPWQASRFFPAQPAPLPLVPLHGLPCLVDRLLPALPRPLHDRARIHPARFFFHCWHPDRFR